MSTITKRLDQFIEYAQKTKKFSDVGFYKDCKAEVERLQARLVELEAGGYTFTSIRSECDLLSMDEVQQWADTQVRTQERYRSVDEVYPVQEQDNE